MGLSLDTTGREGNVPDFEHHMFRELEVDEWEEAYWNEETRPEIVMPDGTALYPTTVNDDYHEPFYDFLVSVMKEFDRDRESMAMLDLGLSLKVGVQILDSRHESFWSP